MKRNIIFNQKVLEIVLVMAFIGFLAWRQEWIIALGVALYGWVQISYKAQLHIWKKEIETIGDYAVKIMVALKEEQDTLQRRCEYIEQTHGISFKETTLPAIDHTNTQQ